eukprot:CAMPEP_0195151338 /NCGR_PEP_ID=MMETSP0448-20130528/180378_1 /TAXON_ID=66468 /ORGANISM="Heterocapsa triquestra, Strain CCMP 448" /LENGTH=71 /DNA_ID=CAMNT_0040190053 /DNA_START=116 /DNA_END=328 /DNA_ORIENTATION=-
MRVQRQLVEVAVPLPPAATQFMANHIGADVEMGQDSSALNEDGNAAMPDDHPRARTPHAAKRCPEPFGHPE